MTLCAIFGAGENKTVKDKTAAVMRMLNCFSASQSFLAYVETGVILAQRW